MKWLKKGFPVLLCALLLLLTACTAPGAAETPLPEQSPAASAEPQETTAAEEEVTYYTTDSPEYRDLCSDNAIEIGMNDDFVNAVTDEDFDALAKKYVKAWKEEYYALMDGLIAAYPEDAEELKGLKDYTDEDAQRVYDETIETFSYTDENGNKTPAVNAEQNANFNMAEIYKDATVLSILNDYRGDTPYEFHYGK